MFGGEFVERLCQCDEARQVGNPLLFEGEGIAGAVPAFMMQRDDLDGFRRQADRPPDARTEIGTMMQAVLSWCSTGAAVVADQVQIMGQSPKRKVLLLGQRQLQLIATSVA